MRGFEFNYNRKQAPDGSPWWYRMVPVIKWTPPNDLVIEISANTLYLGAVVIGLALFVWLVP